ncbi:MAG: N-acetyltransferase [Bacteroidota bacterium]
MQKLQIRTASLSDLDAIAQIDAAAFGGMSYPRFVLRQFQDCFGPLFKVAQVEGHIAAYVLGGTKLHSTTAFVLSLATHPTYARQGLAARLLDALWTEGAALGLQKWQLTVSPNNRAAIALYHKKGFQEIRQYEDYYGDGQDRILMEKQHASH